MSQDRRRLRSHEVDEEAGDPRGAGDLFGDTPLPTYSKAPQVRGDGFARRSKAKGEGTPPRGGAGQPRRGLETVDERAEGIRPGGALTRSEGREACLTVLRAFG
jgi:hypothetical protein